MLWPVRPSLGVHTRTHGWIELCIHDQTSVLPVDLTEALSGSAAALDACNIDLIMPVGLEDVEHFLCF